MTAEAIALKELLIRAEGAVFRGADGGALASLLLRSRRDLGAAPPDDYMAFLQQTDGASTDGLMLYGTQTRHYDGFEIPGLVEINLARRGYRDEFTTILQLGEVDDDIIAYDLADGAYCRVERPSGEQHDRAASLRDLFETILGAPA